MRRHTLFVLLLLASCAHHDEAAAPRAGVVPASRQDDAIVVGGVAFQTGTRVVTWDEPGGYDGYQLHCDGRPDELLPRRPAPGCDTVARYGARRLTGQPDAVVAAVAADGWNLPNLRQTVHQFVIHFDACGTSRRCFEVLHDVRGLSVHFMLDLDGTIYQTLDVAERGRHAGRNNDHSVGIEIANIGAYSDPAELAKWYARDPDGRTRITLPAAWGDGAQRRPERARHPRRDEPIVGEIQEQTLHQYDYTEAQYLALARLTATLHRALPRVALAVPRDVDGEVIPVLLDEDLQRDFEGLVGHHHVSSVKVDPGPAFDWDRVIEDARRLVETP